MKAFIHNSGMGTRMKDFDNQDDLAIARTAYAKMPDKLQDIYVGGQHVNRVISSIQESVQKPFVVCEAWAKEFVVSSMAGVAERAIFFDKFSSNPEFSDIWAGVDLFEKECCDFIISIGGGTAIDVAKGVNILRGENSTDLLDAPRAKHLTLPTTAGTGSESTCFSVLYKNGEKISIEHKGILPEYVILEPKFLHTLPYITKRVHCWMRYVRLSNLYGQRLVLPKARHMPQVPSARYSRMLMIFWRVGRKAHCAYCKRQT